MRKHRRRARWNFSESWLGKWMARRAGVQERFCSKCNQPYVTSPAAKAEEQFISCSAGTALYPYRRAGRKQYRVRLGRWIPNRDELVMSRIFEEDDLKDLVDVIQSTLAYIAAQKQAERDKHRDGLRVAQC